MIKAVTLGFCSIHNILLETFVPNLVSPTSKQAPKKPTQIRIKSKTHNEFSEKVGKFASTFNDDRRLYQFHRMKSYPCGANVGNYANKICYNMLNQKIKY